MPKNQPSSDPNPDDPNSSQSKEDLEQIKRRICEAFIKLVLSEEQNKDKGNGEPEKPAQE
jgi:hypothetical protein